MGNFLSSLFDDKPSRTPSYNAYERSSGTYARSWDFGEAHDAYGRSSSTYGRSSGTTGTSSGTIGRSSSTYGASSGTYGRSSGTYGPSSGAHGMTRSYSSVSAGTYGNTGSSTSTGSRINYTNIDDILSNISNTVQPMRVHPSQNATTRLSVSQSRACLSISELETLMERVDLLDRRKRFQEVQWIYRDKSEEFYTKAFRQDRGVMKAYIKDNTGDPRSPINGKIDGLFFATHQPPEDSSYFGSKRIRVSGKFFMSKKAQPKNQRQVRLYFADFYCMSKMHWVTLVLTYEGTAIDRFCESRLPELDLDENDFLYVKDDGTVMKRTSHNFKTEIFYTANVNLHHWLRNGGVIEKVDCHGQSSAKGKPKKPDCIICNL